MPTGVRTTAFHVTLRRLAPREEIRGNKVEALVMRGRVATPTDYPSGVRENLWTDDAPAPAGAGFTGKEADEEMNGAIARPTGDSLRVKSAPSSATPVTP